MKQAIYIRPLKRWPAGSNARPTAFALCAFTALSAFHASAQEQSRQVTITGRGGSPKCTIEVEVDEAADVEIRGSVGRLHTLRGSAATWRRFECSEPLPLNPANLRFRGIDGRGRQTLIGDSRGGATVVRIEDPNSGREGYTFDLEWDGSGGQFGGPSRGGVDSPGRGPDLPPGGRGNDRDWRDARDGRFSSSDAIHQCGEAAEAELRRTGYSDTRVTNANVDDQPGHNDWIAGTVSGRRGRYVENFSFACPVDFQSRRLGTVSLRPASDGYYGRDGVQSRFSREQALKACGDAVQERLRRDGYRDFRIGNMDLDARPGDNNWVVGRLTARRGGFPDNYEFSCAIDFDGGRVRSLNVNRR